VRSQVLAQHEELRALLTEALELTSRCPTGQREMIRMALLALELRKRFRDHLTFEERKLFPILAQRDPRGPERLADLRLEHGCQRARLDTVVQEMRSGWDVQRVAIALRSLATDLLLDMNREEDVCLRAADFDTPALETASSDR
jgi:hypothetical protein